MAFKQSDVIPIGIHIRA